VSRYATGPLQFLAMPVMPAYHMSENNRELIDAGYGTSSRYMYSCPREQRNNPH